MTMTATPYLFDLDDAGTRRVNGVHVEVLGAHPSTKNRVRQLSVHSNINVCRRNVPDRGTDR